MHCEPGVVELSSDGVVGVLLARGERVEVLAEGAGSCPGLDGNPVTGLNVRLDRGHALGIAGDDDDVVAAGSQLGDEFAADA